MYYLIKKAFKLTKNLNKNWCHSPQTFVGGSHYLPFPLFGLFSVIFQTGDFFLFEYNNTWAYKDVDAFICEITDPYSSGKNGWTFIFKDIHVNL